MSQLRSAAVEGFHARWLVEAVRLRESAQPPHDELIVARLAAIPGDVEAKLIARAVHLDDDGALRQEQHLLKRRETLALGALAFVAAMLGFGLAVGVLGDSGRAVNVVWALAGLLGLHVVSLLLWSLIMMLSRNGRGGVSGRLWAWLVQRLAGDQQGRGLWLARLRLDMRSGAQRWILSAVSHWAWLGLLCGMLLGLLVSLSVRQYGFVWETTLLSADVFERWVLVLGSVPSVLGFPVPDAELVRASGHVSPFAVPIDGQAGRVWALWLIGCVVVYGVVPRVLCWLWCLARLRQCRAKLRLYPGDALYAALADRLMRQSVRMGVSDAAPESIETAHVALAHQASGQSLMLGVELDPGRVGWPPMQLEGVADAGVIDSREQRKRALQSIADGKPHRLLVVCDPALSPDRGTLSLIAELSVHAGECAVWLFDADRFADAERLQHWQDVLKALGLGAQQVLLSAPEARAWVEVQ